MFRWPFTNYLRQDRHQAAPERAGNAGEYQRLYLYLQGRYASRVVLTLSEIQDLLGAALPEPAWRDPGWWETSVPPRGASAQSMAWTLADRTAVVNLAARTVVFDRRPAP